MISAPTTMAVMMSAILAPCESRTSLHRRVDGVHARDREALPDLRAPICGDQAVDDRMGSLP